MNLRPKWLTFTAGSQQTILPSFKRGMVTAWVSTVTKKRQRWSSPSTLNKLAHRKTCNAHAWLVVKPCESFNVIGWLRKNFATPECLLEVPGNGAASGAKSAPFAPLRICKRNFPKKKRRCKHVRVYFIYPSSELAHTELENLTQSLHLKDLFCIFFVILYHDSKYNHDFSYPKSTLREMWWLQGEFHGLLSLSLGHLCG